MNRITNFFKGSSGKSNRPDESPTDDTLTEEMTDKRHPLSLFNVRYRGDVKVAPRMVAIGNEFVTKTATAAASSSNSMIDVVAFVIHCKKHDRLATYCMKSSVDEVRWLPFSPLLAHKSWQESAMLGVSLVLSEGNELIFNELKNGSSISPYKYIQFLEVLRMQMPQNLKFLTRVIYYIGLVPEVSSSGGIFKCCKNTASIQWVDVKQVAGHEIGEAIWGPELVQYARVVYEDFKDFTERIDEISLEEVYYYIPRDPPRNAEETMLLELDVKEKLIEKLYNDFLEHCYPAITLPFGSFKHYMFKFGFEYKDPALSPLFTAFNYLRNGYVSFNELLMGLACIEPQASHCETRLKFIFRFYDNAKGYLDRDSFKRLIEDMYPYLEGAELNKKMDENLKLIKTEQRPDGILMIMFANFAKAVKDHKFRGTSRVCRSTMLVFGQLTRAYVHKRVPNLEGYKEWNDIRAILVNRRYQTAEGNHHCVQCKRDGEYRLASHVIEISHNGYISRPVNVYNLRSRLADAHSTEHIFKADWLPNRIIRMVREFSQNKGTVQSPLGLLQVPQQSSMLALIKSLVDTVKPILESESRCPNVPQPAFIIGDIHGNLEDLLTLEHSLWRAFPCCAGNFVFLGDYVDRGRWSMECALYLLAMKCLAPKRVTLLRGNHEIRAVQEKYSFKKECLKKYGELGEQIWEKMNEIFDVMPIAGMVDRAVFCVHGGLSPKATTIEEVLKMPNKIQSPEGDSELGWEMMWSDPCHIQKYLDIIEITDEANPNAHEGYLFNQKRGAGYLFNERATGTFLAKNDLSFLVRAHEVPPFGFTHHFRNLCTTVFSCSHYCNSDNEASVILVDNNRLRVLRIDTRSNSSATDP